MPVLPNNTWGRGGSKIGQKVSRIIWMAPKNKAEPLFKETFAHKSVKVYTSVMIHRDFVNEC